MTVRQNSRRIRPSPLFWVTLLSACLSFLPARAQAHAVVLPKVSAPGSYEKYVLRVPNEKDVATTRVEIHFPAGARVVSFADVAGWQLEIQRDSAQRIVGAIWTGNLPPERFVEFPFVAVNPKEDVSFSWPTFQTYANGERVDWIGPEGSKQPASLTSISAGGLNGSPTGLYYAAVAAVVISLLALGLALRRTSQ